MTSRLLVVARLRSLALLIFAGSLSTASLWGQIPIGGAGPSPGAALDTALQNVERHTWRIFGKVTDIKGQSVRDAAVHVDIGYGVKFIRDLTSDVQGEFTTTYTLDFLTNKTLSVKLTVKAPGYMVGRESVDFGAKDETWGIDVVLRPLSDPAAMALPDLTGLVETLAPALRAEIESDPAVAPVRKDFERGASIFLDDHNSVAAIPVLQHVTAKAPDCGPCHLFLGLAMLDAGSVNSASKEVVAAEAEASSKGRKADDAEALLIVAEIENWKGQYSKAAGFLVQAKALDPKNLTLRLELGRTLVLQQNWEAADAELAQAAAQGAKEAVLLRAKAVLEEGDPETAENLLKQYTGNMPLRGFPLPVRTLSADIETHMSLRSYAKVQSVVDQPTETLVAAVPELQGLQPAADQTQLADILQKAGAEVQGFFDSFQNTMSVEQVKEQRIAKDGKVKDTLDQRFQYLLLSKKESWGLGLEEFRTNAHGDRTAPTGNEAGLMVTSGFASASLVFHPTYQNGARFRYLGNQTVNGHPCYVIAFAQKPEKAQMVERFNTDDGSVLLLFQGLAWVDAQNYELLRLRTDLLKPPTGIRLQRQTTEITYDPVQFRQIATAMYLPAEVAVTVQWAGHTYRNMHTYSGYKLFNTQTSEKQHEVPVPVDADAAPAAEPAPPSQPPAQQPPQP